MIATTPPADWLTQLAPDRAPPPPGWWPPAPGWWLLLGLVGLALLAVWWLARRRRDPVRVLRRAAYAELARCAQLAGDVAAQARAVEHLLRRYAIARYGRERVAGLAGPAWLAFLAAHGATGLDGPGGLALLRAAYGGEVAGDATAWLAGARGFIAAGARR